MENPRIRYRKEWMREGAILIISMSLKPTRDFEPTEGVCPYGSQDHQTSANQALAGGHG